MNDTIKAILKTRCGCSREVEISRKLQRYFEVYMIPPYENWYFRSGYLRHLDDPVPVDKRTFELFDVQGTDGDARAIYHEIRTESFGIE